MSKQKEFSSTTIIGEMIREMMNNLEKIACTELMLSIEQKINSRTFLCLKVGNLLIFVAQGNETQIVSLCSCIEIFAK
jgi:hypothetical protein